jgi:hypothetical protein
MVHISFWFMPMMLIYWEKCIYYKGMRRSFGSGCKETGLEVNADKTKYLIMSRYQTAGRS